MKQTDPPELPGPVEPLPIDFTTWTLWALSLALVLWTSGAWARRQLRTRRAARPATHGFRPKRSPEDTFAALEERLRDLSAEQQLEARLLSLGLRQACGRIHGHDLSSTTDTRLLDLMEVEADRPDDLSDLLAFATGILFAGRRESRETWQEKLQQAVRWTREGRSFQ